MTAKPTPNAKDRGHASRLREIRAARRAKSPWHKVWSLHQRIPLSKLPAPKTLVGKRLLALGAACTIPAMSVAAEWRETAQLAALEDETQELVTPMEFEIAGQNFPGSAFYFLEDTPRFAIAEADEEAPQPIFDMTGTGELEAAEQLVESHAGPAAQSFFSMGSGLSQGRALDCLTKAVYYEAASEAIGGQRAVAQVVLNRVAHPSYPNSVCGVVFQGSQRRTGCQFSFTCDGSLRRKPGASAWSRAQMVASDALAGQVYAPVGLATHYHTIWIYPYWAPSLHPIGTIGAHRFYRFRGSAGKQGAFRSRYAGAEPSVSGRKAVDLPLATEAADPVALARDFEKTFNAAKAQAEQEAASEQASPKRRLPPPTYSREVEERGGDEIFQAENLPETGTVKEEYRNVGRWIAQPGAAASQPVNTE